MYSDDEYEVRAELGECTAAGDHETVFWNLNECIHCGAELDWE